MSQPNREITSMTEEERAQRAEDLKRQVLALCPPANVGMVDARLAIEEFQELRGLLNDLREIGFEPSLIPDRKLEWIIDNPKQWDHDKTWLKGFGLDQLKEILRLSRIYGAEFLPFENALRLAIKRAEEERNGGQASASNGVSNGHH